MRFDARPYGLASFCPTYADQLMTSTCERRREPLQGRVHQGMFALSALWSGPPVLSGSGDFFDHAASVIPELDKGKIVEG